MQNGRYPSVLHVSQPTDYGVARCVAALAADQVRRGWDVSVACPGGPGLSAVAAASGARVLAWDAARSPARGVAREGRRLRAILAEVDPDVVHLHSSKAGLVGRIVLRGSRPTLFHTHAWSFLALAPPLRQVATVWERVGSRWSTLTICCSEGEADLGRAAGVAGRLQVVPNGVEVPPMPGDEDRRAARRALGLGDGPLGVCVGRLCDQKGQDTLVAAWPEVRRRVPGAELALVGDGPEQERLASPRPEGVRFAGFQPDPRAWLLAADVVSLPSRYEGLSLTLLEAMATGRSVVASDIPGVSEVVGTAPATGALVPPDDPDSLAAALVERLLDPTLAAREGAAAHARAAERYEIGSWCGRISDLTLGLLAGEEQRLP